MPKYGAINTHTAHMGSYRDARMAHALHVAHADYINDLVDQWRGDRIAKPTQKINDLLPEGWVWLSSGLYRCAYLSPKGVVYKVNRHVSDSATMSDSYPYKGLNYNEMSRILKLSPTMPEGYGIPDCTLYHVPGNSKAGSESDYVLAVALVDTSTPFTDCYGDCGYAGCEYNEGNKRVGADCSEAMADVHSGNAFPDAMGIVWVVDIAC